MKHALDQAHYQDNVDHHTSILRPTAVIALRTMRKETLGLCLKVQVLCRTHGEKKVGFFLLLKIGTHSKWKIEIQIEEKVGMK